MLTLIFILSLTLACLSFLLMMFTLKVKLPFFSYKTEPEEQTPFPPVRRNISKPLDIGILDGRRTSLYIKKQMQYIVPKEKTPLLLEYGTAKNSFIQDY